MSVVSKTIHKNRPKSSSDKTPGQRRAALTRKARKFLLKNGVDVNGALRCPKPKLPAELFTRLKLSRFDRLNADRLKRFAVMYAAFLVFRSPLYGDLAETCRAHIKLRKNADKHTPLVMCICGIEKPDPKSRDDFSKLRMAFRRCAASYTSPQKVAAGKSKHGSNWSELTNPGRHRPGKLQKLAHRFDRNEYYIVLVRGGAHGSAKVESKEKIAKNQREAVWKTIRSTIAAA